MKKKILKTILIGIAVVIGVILIYIAYAFISYYRIGDCDVEIRGSASTKAETDVKYEAITWNIGFGAYTDDYDFFMDGGKQSWATSREALEENLSNISKYVADNDADFYCIQEVDTDSTRSYHVDERPYITEALEGYSHSYTPNYDSFFIMIPLTQPHGASKAGMLTLADKKITSSKRVELPVESGFSKFMDLDRCYSKNVIPVDGGKELVLYNLHFSAYSSDGSIGAVQLELLLRDMQAEYDKGNYTVAGGDFNCDLLGDSSKYFGVSGEDYSWAQPLRHDLFQGLNIGAVVPDPDRASCRNPDSPYHEGQFVLTVDGFMVSDNVSVDSCKVMPAQFKYSDHNPVKIRFSLTD